MRPQYIAKLMAMLLSRRFVSSLLLLHVMAMVGCTVFPASKNPSLKTTTSAEQTERLFWQAAAKGDLSTVTDLIAAGAVLTERDGAVLTREQFVERLKSRPPIDFAIGQVTVRPQGNDMVLTYSASVREASGNVTVGVTILSIWQQTKNSGWMLVARSETPASAPLK